MATKIRDLPEVFEKGIMVFIDKLDNKNYMKITAFTEEIDGIKEPSYVVKIPAMNIWKKHFERNIKTVVVIEKEIYYGTGKNEGVKYGRLNLLGYGYDTYYILNPEEAKELRTKTNKDYREDEAKKLLNDDEKKGLDEIFGEELPDIKIENEIKETIPIKDDLYSMLNDGQKTAFDTIMSNVTDEHLGNVFFLSGAPGTGKTFASRAIANELLKYYNKTKSDEGVQPNFAIVAVAPSHKAKNLLEDAMDMQNLPVMTVARYCGYVMDEVDNPEINDEGDFVKIEKGGDVIPKIVGVDFSKRGNDSHALAILEECPVCKSKLQRLENEVALYCVNNLCPAQVKERIIHFA